MGTPTSMLAWVPDGRRQSCESHARQNIRLMCLSFVFLNSGCGAINHFEINLGGRLHSAGVLARGLGSLVFLLVVEDVSSVDHCRSVLFLHSPCVSCLPPCG